MIENNNKKIRLRYHHLVCLDNFIGKGYSPDFTENMTRIKTEIDGDKTEIILTDGCDDICEVCPNYDNITSACRQKEKTNRLDSEWLRLIGYKTGDILTAKDIRAVKHILRNDDNFNKICCGCEWFELCLSVKQNKS